MFKNNEELALDNDQDSLVLENNDVSSNTETPKIVGDKAGLQNNLKSLADYNRELAQVLPKAIFKKQPLRVLWTVGFVAFIVLAIALVKYGQLIFPIKLLLAVAMGMALGGSAFIAHEVLHGAVLKDKKWQDVIGFIGFTPFLISPTYWRFWHNYLHHGNTQLLYKDPDAFPTKMVWSKSAYMKAIFPLTPGSGYFRSYFYFFYWFTFQAVLNQVWMRFGNKMWDKMDHKRVTIEFTMQLAAFVAYMNFIGPENWIWLAVIPFMVQNYTVMSYISTNHNISPYTKINDPLVNSLTVTNHPLLELVHLNFGYHTEHHLFPNMPMSSAKMVSQKLKEMYPDRYKIMPKKEALKILYTTSRIYKNRETLIHPETGKEFQTIQ